MKSIVENIPKSLIYEEVDGKPIYYKGYKAFLLGNNKSGEPMGSSLLQSIIISRLVFLLHKHLGENYYVLTNELGLQLSKGTWRAADIAIYEKNQIKPNQITNKYCEIAPKLVIEIDTKAEIEEVKDTFTYYNKKTDQLLAFGVEKVIWIFTDTKKVMIATRDQNWELLNWEKDIEIINGIKLNINQLTEL
ncbi:MAG: Uma2 family endonuclease [Saprospiraceae bacterium]